MSKIKDKMEVDYDAGDIFNVMGDDYVDNESKSWPDKINSVFEFLGGFFIWLSIIDVIEKQTVAGVSWVAVLFFTFWGLWNVYFYRHLQQSWSWYAGLWITLSNTIWLSLLINYS